MAWMHKLYGALALQTNFLVVAIVNSGLLRDLLITGF